MTAELGEEPTEKEASEALNKYFPDFSIEEFERFTTETYTDKLSLNLDFENKPAKYFIIADTYIGLADLVSLYNHLTGENLEDISVSLAKRVKDEFLNSVAHFGEKYEWIYNPPSIGTGGKYTIGKQLRNEFVQHYGVYAEISYLISNGKALDFDTVNNMKLSDYLATGEYLIRKKIVESID